MESHGLEVDGWQRLKQLKLAAPEACPRRAHRCWNIVGLCCSNRENSVFATHGEMAVMGSLRIWVNAIQHGFHRVMLRDGRIIRNLKRQPRARSRTPDYRLLRLSPPAWPTLGWNSSEQSASLIDSHHGDARAASQFARAISELHAHPANVE